jgi:hypothetical protein
LLVGFWAGLHIFDGDLYNESSATDILLGPSDLCPHVFLIERRNFDVHAFCHSRFPLMSGAIPRFAAPTDAATTSPAVIESAPPVTEPSTPISDAPPLAPEEKAEPEARAPTALDVADSTETAPVAE